MKNNFKIMEVNLATDENSIRMEPTILIPRNDEALNSEYTRIQNQISSNDENLFKKDVDATKKLIDGYNLDQVPVKCRKYVQEAIIKTEQRMGKEITRLESVIANQAQIIEKQAQEIIELRELNAKQAQEIIELKALNAKQGQEIIELRELNAKLLKRILLLEAEIDKLKNH